VVVSSRGEESGSRGGEVGGEEGDGSRIADEGLTTSRSACAPCTSARGKTYTLIAKRQMMDFIINYDIKYRMGKEEEREA